MLYLQILLLLLLIVAVAVASTTSSLGPCETSCGHVAIEFPFGTNKGCYHSSEFQVTCDRSSGQPVSLFRNTTTVITNMSTRQESEMEVMAFIASDCYNTSSRVERNVPSWWLRNFRISTKNMFVAIGCDTHVRIRGDRGAEFDSTGCITTCGSNMSRMTNGSCSGVGCCQVAIPQGMSSFQIILGSYSNHKNVLEFNPCSYAFVVAPGKYNFDTNDLHDFGGVERMPMLLEWAIGDESCEEARKNRSSNFLCNGNSECVEEYGGPGYRCRCKHGYQGNPYISNDCKDINECQLDVCEHHCINTNGGYECRCPKGFSGGNKKNGRGCIADKSLVLQIVLGVSISIGVLILAAASFSLHKLIVKTKDKRQKARFFTRNGGLLLKQQESFDESLGDKTTLFTAKELEKATDHFNENRVLGRGGQGTVYKGMLTDGRIVAVKRSTIVDKSQLEQFINEVVVLSQVNHRNVVKLLGCCLEVEVPLLVSEFISNGTLFEHIHDESDEFPLTLNTRLRIATEVAGALAYLHSATSIPVYHRDIKSSNILVDDKYRAKVADFGTSRFVSIDQTHLTTLVRGTFGYLDPEYLQSNQFTEKSDVYSFGVVLVELLTGERSISLTRFGEHRSLATYFMSSMEEGQVMSIMDGRIVNDGCRGEVMAMSNVAMQCLNLNGKNRPTMKEVASELESIRAAHIPSTTQTVSRKLKYDAGEEEELITLSYD